jgi:hypothetical protein
MRIIGHLDTIYQCLNVKLHLSDANIPMLKADGRLGGVFFLHFLLHAVVFDLTRVSLPGFTFPLASAFQHAPPDFRSDIQTRCWHHALLASELVRKGLHFGREAFDDIFTTDAALEAAKIQIIYASTVSLAPDVIMKTRDCLSSTLHFFATVDRGKSGQNQYVRRN